MDNMIYSLVHEKKVINILVNLVPPTKVEGHTIYFDEFKFKLTFFPRLNILKMQSPSGFAVWADISIKPGLNEYRELNKTTRAIFTSKDGKNIMLDFK